MERRFWLYKDKKKSVGFRQQNQKTTTDGLMRDWKKYNQSLINRGNFFVLISEDIFKTWKEARDVPGRKRYSDLLIQTLLTLRCTLRMTFRAVQGMAKGLLQLVKSPLPVPDYSCLCKRMPFLKDSLPKLSHRRPSVLLIDSSGLKSYGCEEWLRFHHRIKTRSRWIKVHISLDASSQEVITYEVTSSSGSDAKALPLLLDKAPQTVNEVIADGAYDTQSCREAIAKRGAKALIRPRKGSIRKQEPYPGSEERDDAIRIISALGNDDEALDLWKKLTSYGRRSLVETCFSRLKSRFGSRIQSKTFERQCVEVGLKLRLLNRDMLDLTRKN